MEEEAILGVGCWNRVVGRSLQKSSREREKLGIAKQRFSQKKDGIFINDKMKWKR